MDNDTSDTVIIKAVYCPGSSQEEIRRFNFPLNGGGGVFDELRRRVAAASGVAEGAGLSLYYVDADSERVRFSTSEELLQLMRLHSQTAQANGVGADKPLRILAEQAASEADGVEHPGVRCNGCNQALRGRRFRCFVCPDYDLCQRCVLRGEHDQHSMLVLHRPGDADSLPPWLCRFGGGGGRRGPGAWGHHSFPWQQQQQQQQQMGPQQPPFCRPPQQFGQFGMMPPMPQMPPMPPLSVPCPKLAKKLEKARCRLEAKLAKRCERMQHRWARKQRMQQLRQQLQCQQKGGGVATASSCTSPQVAGASADEPIRIDIDEQAQHQQRQQQQQQQQQIAGLTPEEAQLLKQLQKRHRQAAAAGGRMKHSGGGGGCGSSGKFKSGRQHHKKDRRGGRKRRRSKSSSSSSSSGSSSSSSGDSSSDSSSENEDTAEEKAYRQLLKKFKKMGFKDDEAWLRELIREKRGNLNDILDTLRERRQGRDV